MTKRIEYRGFIIKIEVDDYPENPRQWQDSFSKMACKHTHYKLGDEQIDGDLGGWLHNLAVEHDEALGEMVEYCENAFFSRLQRSVGTELALTRINRIISRMVGTSLKRNIIMLPLFLYDHSGLSMSTGPFSCGWDSGQVGYIYTTVKAAKREFPSDDDYRSRAEVYMRSEVKEYDAYLRGDVFGYTIEPKDTNKEILCEDSCWGFIGQEALDHAIADAKANIDSCIGCYAQKVKERVAKSRAERNDLLKAKLIACPV